MGARAARAPDSRKSTARLWTATETFCSAPTTPESRLSIDLNVFDIQRGRDHGVGDYNTLRKGLGLGTYDNFESSRADKISISATLRTLVDVYDG